VNERLAGPLPDTCAAEVERVRAEWGDATAATVERYIRFGPDREPDRLDRHTMRDGVKPRSVPGVFSELRHIAKTARPCPDDATVEERRRHDAAASAFDGEGGFR